MNASNQPARHPIHYLGSPNSEMWMGLIDGIYAIAMTLIALELPELASQLIKAIKSQVELITISGLLTYELIAYTATFLILYELWSFHKSILKISGIKHSSKNLINGLIMALTCLDAGNIILILKAKTELASQELNAGISQAMILKEWITHEATASICMLLTTSSMFGLMSLLARCKPNNKEATSLKALAHATRIKASLFLVFPLNWLPIWLGSETPLAPNAFLIFAYITFSHIKGDKPRQIFRKTIKISS